MWRLFKASLKRLANPDQRWAPEPRLAVGIISAWQADDAEQGDARLQQRSFLLAPRGYPLYTRTLL
jgi:hypothetical protein